jgi:hypothetical protein
VRIAPSTIVMPPTPPPDVDVEAWDDTLDEIQRRAPEQVALIHFGVFDDVDRHLAEMRERLHRFSDFVGSGGSEAGLIEQIHEALGAEAAEYDASFPPTQDHQGLARYWAKRREAEAGS